MGRIEDNQNDVKSELTDDFVLIDDAEIDPQQLVEQIRKRIARRRQELGYEQRHFPTFGAATSCPEPPGDMPYDPDLYHHLRRANELYPNPETGVALAPSPATQLPLLGRLWAMIREQAHGLVLFYVNRSLAHQTTVNRHVTSVLNQLVSEMAEAQREIRELKSDLSEKHEGREPGQ
jgi:hypothetical protein